MPNTSAQIVRSIVADYFKIDNPQSIRISGYISSLPTYKDWWAFTPNGFVRVEPFVSADSYYFLVSVYKGVYTVHTTHNQ